MSSRSKPKTGVAERLAVRLFAHDEGIPYSARRDGKAWHALPEADKDEYRELARVAMRFLAEEGPAAGLGTLASRAAEVARNEAGPAASRTTGPAGSAPGG